MPLTRFGIFLAYGPTVDLQKEGLGRLLGAFLKAAAGAENVRFLIACPEWSRKSLLAFCESEGIPASAFEIVTTDGVPVLLRAYLALQSRKPKTRKRGLVARALARLTGWSAVPLRDAAQSIVSSRSVLPWVLIAPFAAAVAIVAAPVAVLVLILRKVWGGLNAVLEALTGSRAKALLPGVRSRWIKAGTAEPPRQSSGPPKSPIPPAKPHPAAKPPAKESLAVRLYRLMEEAEVERMLLKINAIKNVKAWYSPTAFWPGFNRISAPRLMCVPDVLPAEFPMGFAQLEPELAKNFEIIERSIRGAQHFVTYSSRVKWDTLVDRYSVDPEAVSVIPHASWDLSPWLTVHGFADQDQATQHHSTLLLDQALARARHPYVRGLSGGSLRFLFYPSQFRPNKNLLTLLRAYEYLARQRFIPQKLILTGDPSKSPAVEEFIRENQLGKDVLCLHGLSTPELAACYHLADLSINPSLSEGGFPFTLTEATSVGTPVVMARIPVTEDMIEDPALQQIMLFDPYDWRDAAARIEWALQHRPALLRAQFDFCRRLRQRTWGDVVADYVSVLDRVAAEGSPVEAGRK